MTTQRACAWSLTINNPMDSDEEAIQLARQKGWKVEGQKETGATGTPHYQLLLRTPQVRFSAVKRAFPRAHIEVARNVEALANYVVKADTRSGQLLMSQERYPSLSKLWDLIYDYLTKLPPPPPEGSRLIEGPTLRFRPTETLTRDEWTMSYFDDAISSLIRQGYIVESMAVNPQIRNAWLRYHKSIFQRSHNLQTASQPDTALESAVSIPVYNTQPDGYPEEDSSPTQDDTPSP